MYQMVRNDIACNCIPIVRIAFPYGHILIAFLRILIALHKYAAYLGCCEANVRHLFLRAKLRKENFKHGTRDRKQDDVTSRSVK